MAAGSEGELRRALLAVVGQADEGLGGWADERLIWKSDIIGPYHLWNIRSILKKWIGRGYLERRLSQTKGQVFMFTLEPKGRETLDQWSRRFGRTHPTPTRPPRLDSSVHHLLVVEASIREIAMRQARFLRLLGDEDLRSLTRKGRRMQAGVADQALADGRLRMMEPGALQPVWLDIEILISKYTDEAIKAKYKDLDPATVVFYAPTEKLIGRVERLVGARPHLLN